MLWLVWIVKKLDERAAAARCGQGDERVREATLSRAAELAEREPAGCSGPTPEDMRSMMGRGAAGPAGSTAAAAASAGGGGSGGGGLVGPPTPAVCSELPSVPPGAVTAVSGESGRATPASASAAGGGTGRESSLSGGTAGWLEDDDDSDLERCGRFHYLQCVASVRRALCSCQGALQGSPHCDAGARSAEIPGWR